MTYPLIDLLRALAVLLVMIYHVVGLGEWSFFNESWWGLPFRRGWIGVDMFLVISGFVISLSAARRLQRGSQGFAQEFMERRLRRLVPLYAVTCTIFLFFVRPEILMRPIDQVVTIVGAHVLFIQNFFPLTHGAINGVTWSLALEMQFYVAIIFSMGWLLKIGALRTLVLLLTVSWVWRYGVTQLVNSGTDLEHRLVIYTSQLPGTLDAFGVGIALAVLLVKGEGNWSRLLSTGWKQFFLWLSLAAALLLPAGMLLIAFDNYWAHAGMVVFYRTLLALGFGAILAAAISCPLRGNGPLRPIRYLGEISYGIYLWHFPVLLSLLALPGIRGGRLFLFVSVGSVMLSSLSWHLMEKHWIALRVNTKGVKA